MDDKTENLLIECFHSLGMRKESAIVAFSMLKTNKQGNIMLDWIEKHYKENPSEDRIIQVAQEISEKVS